MDSDFLFHYQGVDFYKNDFVELQSEVSDSPEIWIGMVEDAVFPENGSLDSVSTYITVRWLSQPQSLAATCPEVKHLLNYFGTREFLLSTDQIDSNPLCSVLKKVSVLKYHEWCKLEDIPPNTYFYRLQYSARTNKIIGQLQNEIIEIVDNQRIRVPRNPDDMYEHCTCCNNTYHPNVFPQQFSNRKKPLQKGRPSDSDRSFICNTCAEKNPASKSQISNETSLSKLAENGKVPPCPPLLRPVRDLQILTARRNLLSKVHDVLHNAVFELKEKDNDTFDKNIDKLTSDRVDNLSQLIEAELWEGFSQKQDWQARALSVRRNLTDPGNFSFRRRVLLDLFTPKMFVSEPVASMAAMEVQEARREAEEQYLKREVLLADDSIQLVRKTHKGEEFVISTEEDSTASNIIPLLDAHPLNIDSKNANSSLSSNSNKNSNRMNLDSDEEDDNTKSGTLSKKKKNKDSDDDAFLSDEQKDAPKRLKQIIPQQQDTIADMFIPEDINDMDDIEEEDRIDLRTGGFYSASGDSFSSTLNSSSNANAVSSTSLVNNIQSALGSSYSVKAVAQDPLELIQTKLNQEKMKHKENYIKKKKDSQSSVDMILKTHRPAQSAPVPLHLSSKFLQLELETLKAHSVVMTMSNADLTKAELCRRDVNEVTAVDYLKTKYKTKSGYLGGLTEFAFYDGLKGQISVLHEHTKREADFFIAKRKSCTSYIKNMKSTMEIAYKQQWIQKRL